MCISHWSTPGAPPPPPTENAAKMRPWVEGLQAAGLKVQYPPDHITDLSKVEFALAWNPEPGLLAKVGRLSGNVVCAVEGGWLCGSGGGGRERERGGGEGIEKTAARPPGPSHEHRGGRGICLPPGRPG